MKRLPMLLILLGIIIGIAPIVITLLAALMAKAFGCQIDEGGPHYCIVLGMDVGQLLYGMGLMFWLSFWTIPFGLGMVLLNGVFLGIQLITGRLAKDKTL